MDRGRGHRSAPPAETKRNLLCERRPSASGCALYALSGFIALALEILWFRIVDIGVKSSAFTFGTVLALYLAGLDDRCPRGLRPSRIGCKRPLELFVSLQVGLLAWAAGAVTLICRLPAETPVPRLVLRVLGTRLGLQARNDERRREPRPPLRRPSPRPLRCPHGSDGALVPGPPAGGSRRRRRAEADAWALLQAANIAGCTAGSLLVGLVAPERPRNGRDPASPRAPRARLRRVVGSPGARASAWLFAFVLVAERCCSFRPTTRSGAASTGSRRRGGALLEEDATSVVALSPLEAGLWQVFVNGKSHSILPFGVQEHTLLGAVPALVHPNPHAVAIIGLGSANTAWAVACRPRDRDPRRLRDRGSTASSPPALRRRARVCSPSSTASSPTRG